MHSPDHAAPTAIYGTPLTQAAVNWVTDYVASAKPLQLFDLCSQTELELIFQDSLAYEVPAGLTLVEEGEIGDFMLVLLHGEVEVIKAGPSGPLRLAQVSAGQILGEMALFDRSPRFASCVSLSTVRFVTLDLKAWQQLRHEHPQLAIELLLRCFMMTSDRLRVTSLQLLEHFEHGQHR